MILLVHVLTLQTNAGTSLAPSNGPSPSSPFSSSLLFQSEARLRLQKQQHQNRNVFFRKYQQQQQQAITRTSSSSSSSALHMVLTTPESIIEQASTVTLLDDLIDESVRTSPRKPIHMQFDPSSGWVSTIVDHMIYVSFPNDVILMLTVRIS